MESRGRGGESVKAGPITEHLAHTSGLQRKHIFHDTFNLIFQLIENIHQLLPSDSIYCVHELALTGPAGSSPQGKLQMKAEPGNFELDDIGTLLGSGENSELGPTWECGAGQEGRWRVLETSMDRHILDTTSVAGSANSLPLASPHMRACMYSRVK